MALDGIDRQPRRREADHDPLTDPVRLRADVDHLREKQIDHERECGERWKELRTTLTQFGKDMTANTLQTERTYRGGLLSLIAYLITALGALFTKVMGWW